jgi:hypothetical protein
VGHGTAVVVEGGPGLQPDQVSAPPGIQEDDSLTGPERLSVHPRSEAA